jgi:hypothetical protein
VLSVAYYPLRTIRCILSVARILSHAYFLMHTFSCILLLAYYSHANYSLHTILSRTLLFTPLLHPPLHSLMQAPPPCILPCTLSCTPLYPPPTVHRAERDSNGMAPAAEGLGSVERHAAEHYRGPRPEGSYSVLSHSSIHCTHRPCPNVSSANASSR